MEAGLTASSEGKTTSLTALQADPLRFAQPTPAEASVKAALRNAPASKEQSSRPRGRPLGAKNRVEDYQPTKFSMRQRALQRASQLAVDTKQPVRQSVRQVDKQSDEQADKQSAKPADEKHEGLQEQSAKQSARQSGKFADKQADELSDNKDRPLEQRERTTTRKRKIVDEAIPDAVESTRQKRRKAGTGELATKEPATKQPAAKQPAKKPPLAPQPATKPPRKPAATEEGRPEENGASKRVPLPPPPARLLRQVNLKQAKLKQANPKQANPGQTLIKGPISQAEEDSLKLSPQVCLLIPHRISVFGNFGGVACQTV